MERDQMLCGLTGPAIEAGLVGEIDRQTRRERLVAAWVRTRELDVGKAFAVSAARILSMRENNNQIVLISVSHSSSFRIATLDRSPCSAGKAYNS